MIRLAHAQSSTFNNPFSVGSLDSLLYEIVNVLLVFAVPIIVFFVIYTGFLYVTAQGNPEKVKAANRSLTYAVIGAVIVMGAYAIASIIGSTVDQF